MNRIKVLMVVSVLPSQMLNGLTLHVVKLVEQLKKKCDLTLLVCVPEKKQKVLENECLDGLKVIHLIGSMDPKALTMHHLFSWIYVNESVISNYEYLSQLFRTEEFDIVHVQDYFPASIIEIARSMNVPVVSTVHAIGGSEQKFNDNVRNYMVCNSTKVIAVSNSMREYIVENFDINNYSKVCVIENGVDIREEISNSSLVEEKYIAFAGRLENIKGVDVLINAFSMLVKENNVDVTLKIAGCGSCRSELEMLVETLEITDRVNFCGELSQDGVRDLFAKAQIVVVPSRYEPFGIVALEAMAEKTPIVASRVGGLAEILKNGYSALLVDPDNPKQLAEAMFILLSDRNMCNNLVNNAFDDVKAYTWYDIAQKTLDLYKSILKGE